MNCRSTLVTPSMMFSCVNTCLRFAHLTKNAIILVPIIPERPYLWSRNILVHPRNLVWPKYHFLSACLLRSIHFYHYGHFIPVHIVRNNLQACLHSYLKKNEQSYFWSRVLALCKRWRRGAVWCCYGWQAAASVLLDLQAALMSKGIVLAALLIILSTEKERGRKLRLPLDMSKQTKVCRVWFIQRMSVIQTSLRILMSSVGIIEYWSCLINNLPALCLQDWGAGEI